MGKTADLTVVQKTIKHTLCKEGNPQEVIAKKLDFPTGLYQSTLIESFVEKVLKKKVHKQYG